MEARDRITIGIGLALIVVAAVSREFLWTTFPIAIFAIFLVVWGREGPRTEAFVGRLPGGKYALKVLEQLDMVISPRDKEYEHHIQIIIDDYDHDLQKSLRRIVAHKKFLIYAGQAFEYIYQRRLNIFSK
jgi:hypothetical protein